MVIKKTLMAVCLCLLAAACTKNNFENSSTLRKLYKTYKDGAISRCQLSGQVVFEGGLNAYDAGTVLYDEQGRQIGECNYAWGNVDSICQELTECETVYCVQGNIWGTPAVDKYGLGK